MANESSAIVQLISTAQQEHNAIPDGSSAYPDFTDDLRPIRRSYKVPLLVLAVLLFGGGAALAGLLVGKNLGDEEPAGRPAAAKAAAPAPRPAAPVPPVSAPAVSAPVPAAPAPGTSLRTAPSPAAASPAAPSLAAPSTNAAPPAPAPSLPLTPQILAATGFDIRVKPQATITLDGRVLGKSPLRVRNLTPGSHVVDIEAPAGFFSRRVELELDAGEPQNVNLALDPIDPGEEVASADKKKKAVKARAKKARRDKRRARRKARRSRSKPRGEVVEALSIPEESDKDEPSSGIGTLMVGSKPPCDIYIDGENTGLKTPQRAIELAAGTHQVTLVNTELDIKKTFTVKINAGKRTRAIHDLTGKI